MSKKNNYIILFCGNSGDGIQFIGKQFTNTSVLVNNNVSTFTDFPTEIRPPKDTISGISGFQINFGNIKIKSEGDLCDILVAMNAASLKKNLIKLKNKGTIIIDNSGFTNKKLILAGYKNNPLDNIKNHKIDILNIIQHINSMLNLYPNNLKNIKISKNLFILGYIYKIFNFPTIYTEKYLKHRFINNHNNILDINLISLNNGYKYGINYYNFNSKNIKIIKKCKNINGNKAIALGLISASKKSNLDLFYSSYPITPASNIFNILSIYKSFGIKIFQAEDEIAAATSAIGASYAGNIGVMATSGPGMSLIQESLGLAVILELPLVVINVQRAGPSTGIPTKTEQSDLMQALYGRNGESPIPVFSCRSPAHCFHMAFHAVKISIEHMTPVILLSDSYLANGSESYIFPKESDLPIIKIPQYIKKNYKKYHPYCRNNLGVRPWIIPGMKNYEHVIGSLEKDNLTGTVSHDSVNHQIMVKLRQRKINKISNYINNQIFTNINYKNSILLIISWGSTYGVISTAVDKLINKFYPISHIHIDYIYPLPIGFDKILEKFKKILVIELNNGQLSKFLKSYYNINIYSFNKIQGIPFNIDEIIKKIKLFC